MALVSTQPLTEISTGGKGGRCVGLTTLIPSCVDCLKILEVSTSWSPQALSRDSFTNKRSAFLKSAIIYNSTCYNMPGDDVKKSDSQNYTCFLKLCIITTTRAQVTNKRIFVKDTSYIILVTLRAQYGKQNSSMPNRHVKCMKIWLELISFTTILLFVTYT
jgi:hypothetical protein